MISISTYLKDLSAVRTPAESIRVNCPSNGEAGTNFDGETHFCQYCGSTTHQLWESKTHAKVQIEVANLGTYISDQDLYEAAMKRTRPNLYFIVKQTTDGMGLTGFCHLKKFELAAMVAEWNTGSRTNGGEDDLY